MSEKPKTTTAKPRKKAEEVPEKEPKKKAAAKKVSGESVAKKTTAEKKPQAEKPKTTKKAVPATEAAKTEKPKTPKKAVPKEAKAAKEPEAVAEVPKKKAPKKAKEVTSAKPSKKAEPVERKREPIVNPRLMRISRAMKRRQPPFKHEQAHRWIRVADAWRKIRGNDNNTRRRRTGHIAMASPGYRKPIETRNIHPSGYLEVMVYRPADMEGLDPKVHAIRIGGTVGARKRQEILKRADAIPLRVLNPGAPESAVEEGELFSELEGLEDVEADEK